METATKSNLLHAAITEICPETDRQADRAYNFGAGPAMLPSDVMYRARAEFANWQNSGMSVMEISHRSDEFIAIAEQTETDLRDLLRIPDNYRVLFLQGGA